MKKSIVLTFSDEELFDLERIMLDSDGAGALKFLKKHLEREVRAVISGGQCPRSGGKRNRHILPYRKAN